MEKLERLVGKLTAGNELFCEYGITQNVGERIFSFIEEVY
jgi:hypothetical protein